MAKTKVVANSPLTGEVTVVNGTNVAAPASMKASGSTLDSIKACARQEFGVLLNAEKARAEIWQEVLTKHVRVKQDWEAYAREFSLAIAEHFGTLYGFDATKGHKTWPETAQREYVSRFQNQEAQIKRILVAIEKEGLEKVRKIMAGSLIRLEDGTYQDRKEDAPLSLQSIIKNLPRDSRGRKASVPKTPTVPQKTSVDAAVQGQAAAEFAQPVQAQATEQSKESLAKVAMEHSAKVLMDLIGKCPEEYLPGMLTAMSTRLNDELAPEYKNLAVEIHKAVTAIRERKAGKAPTKKVKQPKVPKAEAKAA